MIIKRTMTSRMQGTKRTDVLCCALVCLSSGFSLVHNVPEWQVWGKWIGTTIVSAVVLFFLFIKLLIKPGFAISIAAQAYSLSMCLTNFVVAGCCVLQAMGIVADNTMFHAISDFDNPAGLAALFCVTFPFSFKVSNNIVNRTKIACVIFLLDACVLFYVQSRAGLLALIVSLLVWAWTDLREKATRLKIIVVVVLLVVVAIVGILFLFAGKIASTQGRLLILRTCWLMINDSPWVGHGMHGFAREYMLYQADYLRTIGDVELLMLAGNVPHPLSEFVLIAVNYGYIGLLLALLLLYLSFKYAWRSKDRGLLIALLAGVSVLCLFSYPFKYPMTMLSFWWCLLNIMVDCLNKMTVVVKRMVAGVALILIASAGICFLSWYKAQVLWQDAIEMLSVDINTASEIKRTVFPKTDAELIGDARYLYSRAVVNYYARDYESALSDAKESSLGISSYDTELLLGEIYHKTGQDRESVMHFRLASDMCPSRISPLYSLFRLYEDLNDTINMIKIGNEMIEMPIKIHSYDTRAMRLEVRRKLMGL